MKSKRPWAIMNWAEKTIFVLGTLAFASIVSWVFWFCIGLVAGFWGVLLGIN